MHRSERGSDANARAQSHAMAERSEGPALTRVRAEIPPEVTRIGAALGTAEQAPSTEERPARAPAPPVTFRGPLVELVAIGLCRPSLEALAAGETVAPANGIDRGYLLKILDEEVGRQFSHPLRPIVELVLNGVDASTSVTRATGAARGVVDVTLGDNRVEVRDEGVGMSLMAILSRLLIPFATDKRAGVDLGRFGVGFFSVLGYGVLDPTSFSMEVVTGAGASGFSIRVVATGGDAASLMCTVRPAPAQRGTRVVVVSALLDADAVRAYVRDALHFLPESRALVRVGGAPINDGSLIDGGRLFVDPLPGSTETVRFHLGGRGLAPGISAATYHAGVKVASCLAVGELTLIDFPGAVELTEGRDALKPGPLYDAVATAFHRRLLRSALSRDGAGRERIAEIAAQVSALLLQSAGWTDIARELATALLGKDRYLVGPERSEAIVGFLGPHVAGALFVPSSFWAEREWYHVLPGERELLERELWIDPPEPIEVLAQRRSDLDGLAVLLARAAAGTSVALVRSRRGSPAGPLPCLGRNRTVLLREDAPSLQSPRGWADVYALRAAWSRASGGREADVEREIIVNEPARMGIG